MNVTNSKKAKKLSALQTLLAKHSQIFTTLPNGKIKCVLTAHEFMPSQANVNAHLQSKSYKKAIESQFDITEYEQVLSTHKDGQEFLFCRLTGARVPKKKTAITKHVNGKRFLKRFQQYLENIDQEEDIQQEAQGQEDQIDQQIEEQQQNNQKPEPKANKVKSQKAEQVNSQKAQQLNHQKREQDKLTDNKSKKSKKAHFENKKNKMNKKKQHKREQKSQQKKQSSKQNPKQAVKPSVVVSKHKPIQKVIEKAAVVSSSSGSKKQKNNGIKNGKHQNKSKFEKKRFQNRKIQG